MKTFITLILFGIIYEVIGCRCPVREVDIDFCKSDFAIKLKVKSQKQLLPGIECYYEIEVLQIYKENNDTQKALSSKRIHTAQDTGGCGRILEFNKTYVITGSIIKENDALSARTTSCTFGKDVEEFDEHEKQFFDKEYKNVKCVSQMF